MNIFFLRFLFILTLVFFECSFFDILFPATLAPFLLITSIVVWVLLSGFPQALFMIIPLAVLFDIVTTGMPNTLTLYAVPLAYTTSFLSRRLLVEHRGAGMFLYALFAAIGALGYTLFDALFFHTDTFLSLPEILPRLWLIFSFSNILSAVTLSLPIFFLVYVGIRRFEEYTGTMSRKDFLSVK